MSRRQHDLSRPHAGRNLRVLAASLRPEHQNSPPRRSRMTGWNGLLFVSNGRRTANRRLAQLSRKARLTWSISGLMKYEATLRSPVVMNVSTGMPGISETLPSRWISAGVIAMRAT